MTKVLITPRGFAKNGLEYVAEMEKVGIEVHYNDTGLPYTAEQFLALAKGCDGIIVGVDKMDASVLEQLPDLKVICKFGVGTDNIDLNYCKDAYEEEVPYALSNSLGFGGHNASILIRKYEA